MNYEEYKENEKKISKRNDLEYLKIKEEIKYALCNIERKAKEHNLIKSEDKEEER